MDRIIGTDAVDLSPGKKGFRSKDTVAGVPGTVLTAKWANDVQEELAAIVEISGKALDAARRDQVIQAIRSQRTNYTGPFGGTANAVSIALVPAPASWADMVGMPIRGVVVANNTGPATLAVGGLAGVKDIVRADGSPLVRDDLVVGQITDLVFTGTVFQVEGLKTSNLPPRQQQIYDVAGSYTFVTPPGVYRLFCRLCGGGGGAGGVGRLSDGRARPGGGGGAGGYAEGWINVTPGQSIPVTVGGAGVGGSASSGASPSDGTGGSAGGTSSVGAWMSTTGGVGGGSSPGAGGAGGVGSGGAFNSRGGYGGDGSGDMNYEFYGGNGGASAFGGGGRAASFLDPAIVDGQAPGSGGGAIYRAWAAAGRGGHGRAGVVILQW